MMNAVATRIPRTPALLVCSCLLLSGCGELAKTGLKGALRKAGAKVVENSSDETLRQMFEQANAECPVKVDIFTTLEEVEMIDDTRVEFRYLVNDAGRKLTSRFDKGAMKRSAVEHMKGNPMAVAIAERDLSIEHIYLDSSGNHLLSYTINRAVLDGDLEPVGQPMSNPFDVRTVATNDIHTATEAMKTRIDSIESAAKEATAASRSPQSDLEDEMKLTDEQESHAREIARAKSSIQDFKVRREAEKLLPQKYESAKTRDNPAGVQSNPHFGD